ncbi:MAG: hypothetical protein ACQKBY_13465 [Verrucomicrobiales bacterium]
MLKRCFLVFLILTGLLEARTCRFLFLNAPAGAPDSLVLFDGESSQKVALPRMNFSPPYSLRKGELTLRLLEKEPAAGEEVPRKAPALRLPAAVSDCFILLVPAGEGQAGGFRMELINANPDQFQKGEMLWLNLTGLTIGGVVGERRLMLKPRSRLILPRPSTRKGGYPVNLAFQIPGDERVHPLTETQWTFDPQSRSVQFVVREKGRRAPRILGFSDFRGGAEE